MIGRIKSMLKASIYIDFWAENMIKPRLKAVQKLKEQVKYLNDSGFAVFFYWGPTAKYLHYVLPIGFVFGHSSMTLSIGQP